MHSSLLTLKSHDDRQDVPVRAAFRGAGRAVKYQPDARDAHEIRVLAALAFDGSEPLQAALVDMLHGCQPQPDEFSALLRSDAIAQRLAPHVQEALLRQAQSGKRLPQVSTLATRWCVLAVPAMDVPRRALLNGVDDSRGIASRAEMQILAGDKEAEEAFLQHCEGAHDTLAFMLVRRALRRQGVTMDERWSRVSAILQGQGDAS